MADRTPEISGASIVLVGSFNPKIFQPEWFARQGLLRNAEAEAADIKIVAPQICHFETESFIVQVTQERFLAASKPNVNSAPLRDLVQGTFFILEHTPVTAMGLNYQMHFAMGSEETWHLIGDRLAPKEGWQDVLEGRPGLLSMTIRTNWSNPPGTLYHVRVEPSMQVKHGVFFEANEHYPGRESEQLKGLMEILAKRWEEGQVYASRVTDHILAWATTRE
jgi:hypothetical protein